MDTTWAAISWSVPSYIPSDYPIITYEIGYHVLQSDNCSMVDDDDIIIQALNQYNVSSNNTFTIINGLDNETCYIFGVRAYTDNGYGAWTVTTNETLELLTQSSPIQISPSSTIKLFSTLISPSSTVLSLSSSIIQTSGISIVTIINLIFLNSHYYYKA